MWHKKQDRKTVQPPMSAMVQIVTSPEELITETAEPKDKGPALNKVVKQKPRKEKKPNLKQKTLSRKGPSAKELEYAQELTAFIEKNRFYPKQAWRLKKQGTVVVSLTVLNSGDFTKIELVEASPHSVLDKAALSFLKGLKKFKPLPNPRVSQREYIVPIFYKIRR